MEVVFLAFELELLLLKLGVGLLQLAQALPHGALVVAAAVCTCTHRFSLRGKRNTQNRKKNEDKNKKRRARAPLLEEEGMMNWPAFLVDNLQ